MAEGSEIRIPIEIDFTKLDELERRIDRLAARSEATKFKSEGAPFGAERLPARTFVPETGEAPEIRREKFRLSSLPIFGGPTTGLPVGSPDGAPFQPVPDEADTAFEDTPISAKRNTKTSFWSRITRNYRPVGIAARHATHDIYQTKALFGFISAPTDTLLAFAFRFVPILMPVLVGAGLVQRIVAIIFGPGGPLDVRLREFAERRDRMLSLREQNEILQGNRIFRISSYYGIRGGQGQVKTSLDNLKVDGGQNASIYYDRDLHFKSKGVFD